MLITILQLKVFFYSNNIYLGSNTNPTYVLATMGNASINTKGNSIIINYIYFY